MSIVISLLYRFRTHAIFFTATVVTIILYCDRITHLHATRSNTFSNYLSLNNTNYEQPVLYYLLLS